MQLGREPAAQVVVDLDAPGSPLGSDEVRCDYLIVRQDGGGGWIVPLELKSGNARGRFFEQLQAGADAAAHLLPPDQTVVLRPVVACRGVHSKVKKMLREKTVRFRGAKAAVRLIACGAPLVKALT